MKKIISLLIVSTALSTAFMGCEGSNNNKVTAAGQAQDDSPAPYPVADAERTKDSDQLVELRKQMILLEGNLIAPAKEDLTAYADFLNDKSAGMARVFSRGSERSPLLVSGGGAYYQFKNRTNEYGQGSDVEYDGTNSPIFSVGFAGVDYGFFAQLGKVDIRQIDGSNSTVAAALSYTSASGQAETSWRNENTKFRTGQVLGAGGAVFKSDTTAVVGMSYVERSISESHYDVAVVFQVVRRDPTDGSLILAWKLLKDFGTPSLLR